MYHASKIAKLPINNILADGITFRLDKRDMGFRIAVAGEVIWNYPRDFMDDAAGSANAWARNVGDTTWHNFHLKDLYGFLKRYLDTPRGEVEDFEEDYVDLRDILHAADKRRSRHGLGPLLFKTNSARARKVARHRIGKNRYEA